MTVPEIPRTMKAQFLDAYRQPYSFRDAEVPATSSPHDLLVKVDAAGYCHTDATLVAGHFAPNPPSFPHIGCHEFAGTVVKLSEGASPAAKNFPVGTRVGIPSCSFHPCGTCFECTKEAGPDSDAPGYSVYCAHALSIGVDQHGGFAEYALADARQVVKIPDGFSSVDTAPMMCAGMTIYAALKKCDPQPGRTVGIMGCGGGLGHLGLQFATKMGMAVVGVDAADQPVELAESLSTGAWIVDARKETANAVVKELGRREGKKDRGEMGVDCIVILTESQKAFDYGVQLVKNHGTVVVVSYPVNGFNISAMDIVARKISFVGCLLSSNKLATEMLEFAANNGVKAVQRRYPLSDLNRLVEEYHRTPGGKLVVDMSM
ncbi:GroES-like protein [Rhizodiscina lignyota]|uniref:GroES-like protein n=1 Tax=Rhizodiscina lignyota TaxID=1504668 RepID=A0A9P4M8J4_9PEZI|nr:GroES-like protein [Rhizodiscina lignyota]